MSEQLPAVAQEIATIERQVGTADYWRSEPMQQRYRDLLDARDAGGAVPASPSAAEQRIAAIERMMRDPRSEYWRGERPSNLQAEYRHLWAAATAWRQRSCRKSASSWRRRRPGARRRTRRARGCPRPWCRMGRGRGARRQPGPAAERARVILGGIGEEGPAAAFLDGFSALPEYVARRGGARGWAA